MAFAAQALIRAEYAPTSAERFAAAQVAALRVAAAVLAQCAAPSTHAASQTAWEVLARRAPRYAEWARYFAVAQEQVAGTRDGSGARVGARLAGDHLRAATDFYLCVERWAPERVSTQVLLPPSHGGAPHE